MVFSEARIRSQVLLDILLQETPNLIFYEPRLPHQLLFRLILYIKNPLLYKFLHPLGLIQFFQPLRTLKTLKLIQRVLCSRRLKKITFQAH
jgi:hypothetical protein